MPHQRPFKQVDVFSATPYFGNALAVVLDASGMTDDAMQRFAAWTNLAETTFVLPPTPEAAAAGADYQVRIFTTAYEMPFAGHPTLGTCHAWLEQGGQPRTPGRIVQQCKVGLVTLQPEHGRLAFAAPPMTRTSIAPELLPALLSALGVRADQVVASQRLVNGPQYFGLLLDSDDTVLSLTPDFAAIRAVLAQGGCSGVGIAALATKTDEGAGLIRRSNREARAFGASASQRATDSADQPDLEVRMFVSDLVVAEDPITGSFNASLAQWLIADGHAPSRYVAAQGRCVGRDGRVYVEQDPSGQVWVGGHSVTCVAGQVFL